MSDSEVHDSVVVGVDGSPAGYVGVRYAALEAHRTGAPLEVVTVVPGYLPVGPLPMIPDGALQSYGREALEESLRVAEETVPGLRARSHLLSGRRVGELVEISRHARLLVLGARHASAAERLWTGSTVTGVSARAACPVVVVPPSWRPAEPYGRIVAGLKAPPHSAELFGAAFGLADELAAELVVLHAWHLPGAYDDIIVGRIDQEQWLADERAAVEPLLTRYREAYPEVENRLEVMHAPAARALLEVSRAADRVLILRPAHGGYLHHLGGTARALLRAAQCPVEVVPPAPKPADTEGLDVERAGDLVR